MSKKTCLVLLVSEICGPIYVRLMVKKFKIVGSEIMFVFQRQQLQLGHWQQRILSMILTSLTPTLFWTTMI